MANEVLELHAIVRGRVQGVGFRATVQHHAKSLGLVGTVKNLPDGSVELYAQGEDVTLESLLTRIQEDNGFAHVTDISKDLSPTRKDLEDFSIIF